MRNKRKIKRIHSENKINKCNPRKNNKITENTEIRWIIVKIIFMSKRIREINKIFLINKKIRKIRIKKPKIEKRTEKGTEKENKIHNTKENTNNRMNMMKRKQKIINLSKKGKEEKRNGIPKTIMNG